MQTHVLVNLGNEIDEETKEAILAECKNQGLRVNRNKPSGNEKIGFKIHKSVSNKEAFEESIKSLINQLNYLYIIAPLECLEDIKHHPRIRCYDTTFLKDPTTAMKVLIKYAYHGYPL